MSPKNVANVAEALSTITKDRSLIDNSTVISAATMLENIVNVNDTSPEVGLSSMNEIYFHKWCISYS